MQPGRNYGWPCYEGSLRTTGYKELDECRALYTGQGPIQRPVSVPAYEYDHNDAGASVQAGPQYTGTAWPSGYRGAWFFGDYNTGQVKRYSIEADGTITGVQDFATNYYGTELLTHPGSGDLVYVDFFAGAVRRVSYAPGNRAPSAAATATPSTGAAPLAVQLSAAGSSDADGDALSYRWDFGDGTPASTERSPSHTYAAIGDYSARVTVDDGRGRSDSATVAVSAGNSPPTVSIASPTGGGRYRAGTPIALSGSASDAQDGALTGTALRWEVRQNHNEHFHPVTNATGATATVTDRADHDADAYYVIKLTATDSRGGPVSCQSFQLAAARCGPMYPVGTPIFDGSAP